MNLLFKTIIVAALPMLSAMPAIAQHPFTADNANPSPKSEPVCAFEAQDMALMAGKAELLPVKLVNEAQVIGMQCDIRLPEGVALATDQKGNIYVEAGARAASHDFDLNVTGGVVRIVATSQTNAVFVGSDGVLFSLPLIAGGDSRTATLTIENICLSKVGNVLQKLDPVACTLTISSVISGDANGDGGVSMADVAVTIDYFLNKAPGKFVLEAADINGDGNITMSDVAGIIDIFLGKK